MSLAYSFFFFFVDHLIHKAGVRARGLPAGKGPSGRGKLRLAAAVEFRRGSGRATRHRSVDRAERPASQQTSPGPVHLRSRLLSFESRTVLVDPGRDEGVRVE